MFEKKETLSILFKMVIIAAIGLFITGIFYLIKSVIKNNEAIAIINLLEMPLIFLIGLVIWFSIILTILKLYWGQDELANGIKSSSIIIIIGVFLEKFDLSNLNIFSQEISAAGPLLKSIGTIILLFGFVILFYNILRYVWVKI
jgi:hypothetical protein